MRYGISDKQKVESVLSILKGKSSTRAVAMGLGVTMNEVEQWTALFLGGLKHQTHRERRPQKHREQVSRATGAKRRGVVFAMVLLFGILTSGAVLSTGAHCTAQDDSLLCTVSASIPAKADEVKGNFSRLFYWLQKSSGTVESNGVIANDGVEVSSGEVMIGKRHAPPLDDK